MDGDDGKEEVREREKEEGRKVLKHGGREGREKRGKGRKAKSKG